MSKRPISIQSRQSAELVIGMRHPDRRSLLEFLENVDELFPVSLSEKVNLSEYADKLLSRATLCTCYCRDKLVGLAAGYLSRLENNWAYLAVVGVRPEFQRRGIARRLVQEFIGLCQEKRVSGLHLYTDSTNVGAIRMYEGMGFEVEAAHHEVGDGQQEIDFRFDDALTTADRCQTFKMVTRAIARKHGLFASFMAKPVQGQAGNGMHNNMSLFKNGKNVFYDKDGEFHLSNTALYFLNGILEHARAITAIGNPTVNSYKRLIPGFEAPVYIAWAAKNRSPLVRIPSAGEINTRLEMRSADPTANPYLLLAACLTAGLNGIKEQKMPMKPVEENIFEMTEEERAEHGIKPLPTTLHNAIKAFKKDDLIKSSLGDHLMHSFIESKELEWSKYSQSVSDWERQRYMNW